MRCRATQSVHPVLQDHVHNSMHLTLNTDPESQPVASEHIRPGFRFISRPRMVHTDDYTNCGGKSEDDRTLIVLIHICFWMKKNLRDDAGYDRISGPSQPSCCLLQGLVHVRAAFTDRSQRQHASRPAARFRTQSWGSGARFNPVWQKGSLREPRPLLGACRHWHRCSTAPPDSSHSVFLLPAFRGNPASCGPKWQQTSQLHDKS